MRNTSPNTTKPASKVNYRKKVFFDFAIVISIFLIAYSTSSYFNFSDNYFLWAKQYEQSLDIDELPVGLLVSLAALLWFARRRIYEANVLLSKNHALLQRVLEVQEMERKRIAQDLHDELGQYLSAIKAQATSLLVDSSSSQDTLITAKRIVLTADYGYQAAKHMMHSLRPVALDELGLTAALEHLVQAWRDVHPSNKPATHYTININQNIDQLNEHLNIGVFRIVQEALTNVEKHAKATHVAIEINCTKHDIILHVKDNGIGFDADKKNTGYGLISMIERAEALNGEIIISSDDNGTLMTATINKNQPSFLTPL